MTARGARPGRASVARSPPGGRALRLVLASDLHYDLRQLDWLVGAAPDVDLVVLAGDLLDVVSPVPLQAQITVVREYLSAMGEQTQVAVCSGNHDLDHRRPDGEKATDWLRTAASDRVHVDGACLTIDGVLVSVLAWWEGPATRALVDEQLARDAGRRDGPWVWVHHAPPEGALSWTGRQHFGDDQLATWVDQHRPDVVLCGHIHQSPFTAEGSWVDHRGATALFNAGRQPGDVPAHVVLDLAAGEARWSSLTGPAHTRLGAS